MPKKSTNKTELDEMREWLNNQIKFVNIAPSPSEKLFKLAKMEEHIDAKILEKQTEIDKRKEGNFRFNKRVSS